MKFLLMAFVFSFFGTQNMSEMPVSLEVQYPLLLKIITFDRNHDSRLANNLMIGIVYQGNYRTSKLSKEELTDIIEKKDLNVEGKKVSYTALDVSVITDLTKQIKSNDIDVLFILPLRMRIDGIISESRKNRVMTFSGVPKYIEDGASVGIDIKGDKPLIVINLNSAKAEGVDFNSQLLKLAKIL